MRGHQNTDQQLQGAFGGWRSGLQTEEFELGLQEPALERQLGAGLPAVLLSSSSWNWNSEIALVWLCAECTACSLMKRVKLLGFLSSKQKLVYCNMPVQKELLTSAVLSTSQKTLKPFRIKIGFKLLTASVFVIVHGCTAIDLNGSEMGCYILSMGDSPYLELQ